MGSNDLLFTMYGNSPGIEVQENIDGGLFSQSLQKVFAANIEKGENLLRVLIAAKKELKKLSGHDQLVDVTGDPQVQEKVFARKLKVNQGRGAGGRANASSGSGQRRFKYAHGDSKVQYFKSQADLDVYKQREEKQAMEKAAEKN